MTVEHRFELVGVCPVNQQLDRYVVVVRVSRVVPVEKILDEASIATSEPIFQEDLTRELAQALQAEVETVGEHSGVTTTCVCRG